jgi:hypothetical protein
MTIENILKIKLNEEYTNLVPPLSTNEYESLKQDIKQNGIQIPIVTNQDGDILDGHHRYKIWVVDLAKPVQDMPKPTVLHYEDKLQEKLFVINVNLKRRQLNNFQRVELELKVKPILEKIAEQNSRANLKQNQSDLSTSKYLELGDKGVAEEIGNRAGVSHETVRKVETILQKAPEEIIQKNQTGTNEY